MRVNSRFDPADAPFMLSLRQPPDFAALAAQAEQVDAERMDLPPIRAFTNRRSAPRRAVHAPVYLGVVPRGCDRYPLSKLPVTVFKPLDAGWAMNLSTSGLAMLTDHAVEVGQRRWCRLDHVAIRPTILPARITSCDPLEDKLFRVRLTFMIEDASLEERLGFASATADAA